MSFRYVTTAAMLACMAGSSLLAGAAFAQEDMSKMPGMAGMKMDAPKTPAGSASANVGGIEISGGFVKAMLPGQPVGGGYLTIHNAGADDRLVSVASALSGKVELHEMKMENNIMKMRELKEGIPVPAGATVTLAPNGLHMMFKQVKAPFKQGGTVPVTLTFEKAGPVDITLPVSSPQGN